MLSFYRKLLLSPIISFFIGPDIQFSPEGASESTNIGKKLLELRSFADELSLNGVDRQDINDLLSQIDEDRENISSQVKKGEKEIITSLLRDLGADIANGNLEGIFQDKFRFGQDRKIVFDSYKGFGGEEILVLSRNTVGELIKKIGMSRNEIIDILGLGNKQYAEMLADMLISGNAQRGPSPDQVEEMNKMREVQEQVMAGNAQRGPSPDQVEEMNKMREVQEQVMAGNAQRGPSPDQVEEMNKMREVQEQVMAGNAQRGPNPDQVEEILTLADTRKNTLNKNIVEKQAILSTDNEHYLDPTNYPIAPNIQKTSLETGAIDENMSIPQLSQASIALFEALEKGDGKVSFSEIRSSRMLTGYVQARLVEEFGIKKIKEILGKPDLSEDQFIDGIYGNWTSKIVSHYQTENKLIIDGAAGTQTFSSMTNLEYDASEKKAIFVNGSDQLF